MSQLAQDVRYAFRQLLRSPGFTATAIVTLALGIGANTAAFTLLYGMLLRPLPVPAPDQLYRLGDSFTCCGYADLSTSGDQVIFSYENYLDLKEHIHGFQELAAIQSGPAPLSVKRGGDSPRTLVVAEVSGNYFKTFGVTPFLGKLLSDTDDQLDAAHVAVLNYDAWKTEFNGDPSILATTVLIQSIPFRIVGIAQRGFFGERVTDHPPAFWVPLASDTVFSAPVSMLRKPATEWLWLVGRIRPGTKIQALQSSISEESRRWLMTIPEISTSSEKAKIPKQHVVLTPVPNGIQVVVSFYRPGLKLLLILSSVVLLIACANIANLLLARGIARSDDLAMRMALGASRRRIISQIFTENLLLSCIGGIVALAIACTGSYLTLNLGFPEATTLPIPAIPSLPVLGFAFLVSLLIGILLGTAPARLSMFADPAQVMRGSIHSVRGLSQLPQKALLVVQAALTLVLLTVAILATRSLLNLTHQPMGFDPTNRYVLSFNPASSSYPKDRWPELYSQVESRFSKLGDVARVGLVANVPFNGYETSDCIFIKSPAPDRQLADSAVQCGVARNHADAAFFDAMGIGISQGRNFSLKDTSTSLQVAIVSQSFAQRFFPNQNALGRHFESSPKGSSRTWEIVGVFPDIKIEADEATFPTYYTASTQPFQEHESVYLGSVVLHFNHPPQDADGMLRRTMARVDPNLPVTSLHTMDSLIGGTLSQQRVTAWLSIVFGVLAIALASVGLYGVATYIVVRRTHEIGIRMALGSTRSGVISLILRSVLVPVALGLALGLPCSLAAGYSIRSLLYQLPWYEPIGLVTATLLLSLCAIAAGLIPARRAASIQPMQALRVE
jgi:predicted permease